MSYIRLVNVTKRFGNVTAVDNLNLEIGKGECFSMLGPSGCGKTTLFRKLAGERGIRGREEGSLTNQAKGCAYVSVSYTHLRAHET